MANNKQKFNKITFFAIIIATLILAGLGVYISDNSYIDDLNVAWNSE